MALFTKREQKKIRETIELYVSAFNERDFKQLMSLIAPDEDFLYIEEDPVNRIVGIGKFEDYVRDYFSNFREIEYNIDWMFFSFVDNMCWVNIDSEYKKESNLQEVKYSKYVTFTMEKRRGDWFIVHVLNSIDLDTYNVIEKEVSQDTLRQISDSQTQDKLSEHTEVYNFNLDKENTQENLEDIKKEEIEENTDK